MAEGRVPLGELGHAGGRLHVGRELTDTVEPEHPRLLVLVQRGGESRLAVQPAHQHAHVLDAEVAAGRDVRRERALAPLYAARQGDEPRGARRLEEHAPEFAATPARTVAGYDVRQCAEAVRLCVELYRQLRSEIGENRIIPRTAAEQASTRYLAEISRGLA
jgi:hypothetical protein